MYSKLTLDHWERIVNFFNAISLGQLFSLFKITKIRGIFVNKGEMEKNSKIVKLKQKGESPDGEGLETNGRNGHTAHDYDEGKEGVFLI